MKTPLTCQLFSYSDTPHLQQLYTGYRILHDRNVVRVKQIVSKKHLKGSRDVHLKVVVNDRTVLYYDTHDSYEIDEEALHEVDFYFKRSYADTFVKTLSEQHKIFPLGLNYPIYGEGFDRLLLKRASLYGGVEKIKTLVRAFNFEPFLAQKIYTPRVSSLTCYPDFNAPPKVLFMVGAWNPNINNVPEKQEEIRRINETRAQCVRLLRREFGENFCGGFAPDDYATKHYGDCLLHDGDSAKKKNYLKILLDYPICIATTGLNNSIGWKLAEYVAHAKAIVAERLNYRVPGSFENGVNYLEFSKPEVCVEAAVKLFENRELRCRMMANNFRYYQSYLRPDALILNTLEIALRVV